MQRIELIWDLDERIKKALDTGRTGDLEVIQSLCQRADIEWIRNGTFINAESLQCAVERNFEMRPFQDNCLCAKVNKLSKKN